LCELVGKYNFLASGSAKEAFIHTVNLLGMIPHVMFEKIFIFQQSKYNFCLMKMTYSYIKMDLYVQAERMVWTKRRVLVRMKKKI